MSDARAFAARNRQGSDWFSHDGAAASQPSAATPGRKPAPVREASEAVAVVAPSPAKNGVETPTPGGRAEMIKPSCNSNQWYKYDSTADKGTPTAASKPSQSQTRQATGDWYSNEKTSADEQKESKPRVMTTEGESYCRRDKAGSSASWFTHDHGAEDAASAAASGSSTRVHTKEGSNNASRMRGQSENWFSHEGGRADVVAPESLHVSKGRAPKAQTSEMHDVFHMK